MTKSNVPSSPGSILQKGSTPNGGLGIVIVNWNSGRYLRECLASFAQCEGLSRVLQVVVVDNDSHDDSFDELPPLPVPVRLIRNSSNLGFAVACNQGAAMCDAEYLLFLNPDTVLHADSLRVPLEYLDDSRNADVGICGIQLIDGRGRIGRTCSRLPTAMSLLALATRLYTVLPGVFPPHFMKEWDHGETREVEQVIGAFFVVRRELYVRLRGFDERFFVYYEEVDFCERARWLGTRVMFLATAQATHAGGGCSQQIRGRSLFYTFRSRIQYARKHLSPGQASAVDFATNCMEPLIRSITMILSFRFKNLRVLWRGFSLLWWDRFFTSLPQTSTCDLSGKFHSHMGCESMPTMSLLRRQLQSLAFTRLRDSGSTQRS